MTGSHVEALLQRAERRAVLIVLRQNPDLTLGHLLHAIEQNDARGPLLRELTLGELFAATEHSSCSAFATAADSGPPIDHARLELAERLSGADFDECVRAVLDEAGDTFVSASYLRARLGGPRWKLQGSLRRLVEAGVVERSGSTSGTRYRARART